MEYYYTPKKSACREHSGKPRFKILSCLKPKQMLGYKLMGFYNFLKSYFVLINNLFI